MMHESREAMHKSSQALHASFHLMLNKQVSMHVSRWMQATSLNRAILYDNFVLLYNTKIISLISISISYQLLVVLNYCHSSMHIENDNIMDLLCLVCS